MKSRYHYFKNKAISLRREGKTYGEIQNKLGQLIPKSTLSVWFRGIVLSTNQKRLLKNRTVNNISKSRALALAVNRRRREQYLESVADRVKHLKKLIRNRDVAKIVVAMLYLGEGTKSHKGSLTFGNSDPKIICLFLRLLRYCYDIDENKFRCTLQCRADQNINALEKFWSKTTNLSLKQFYKAQVDPRTIGRPSRNPNYKGVCRIDYFSADIYNELMKIAEIV